MFKERVEDVFFNILVKKNSYSNRYKKYISMNKTYYFNILLILFTSGCIGRSAQNNVKVESVTEILTSSDTELYNAIKTFQRSRIVTEKSCLSCHTIGDRGGTVGPILDQVSNRRSEDWLRRWLKDPNEVKSGTKMPNFQFSDEEIDGLVSYLTKLRREIPSEKILNSNFTLEKKGNQLLDEYSCKACHRIGDEGRFTGVDLTWVGKRKSQEWEINWLKNPQAWKPDTFMPDFNFSHVEAEALAAYLHTLQGEHNAKGQSWETRAQFFLGGSSVQAGKMVYNRFGCWGCHGERGRKPDKNPNAKPDEKVPKLWGVTNRLSNEEVELVIRNGSSPETLRSDRPSPPFSCPEWGTDITDGEMMNLIAYLKTLAPKKKKWRFKS